LPKKKTKFIPTGHLNLHGFSMKRAACILCKTQRFPLSSLKVLSSWLSSQPMPASFLQLMHIRGVMDTMRAQGATAADLREWEARID
jgi:hypothetical protein